MSMKLQMAIQAYATVSRRLRMAETKAIDNAALLRIHTRLSVAGIPERQMGRIMKRARSRTRRFIIKDGAKSPMTGTNDQFVINVPMPAPEPAWIDEADAVAGNLHMERTIWLRRELRAANLAYAFLRGMPFYRVEAKGHEPIPVERIAEIAEKYSDSDTAMRGFEKWRVDALANGEHPSATKFDETSKNDMAKSKARYDKSSKANYANVF